MSQVKTADGSDIVFLFSTVPPNRPNYKRAVLDVLCYPIGHRLDVSYKQSYFEPSLTKDFEGLLQSQAVFVFVDYDGAGQNFIPIRYARIVSCGPKETSKKVYPETRVYMRIELGDLILIENQWDACISQMSSRPRLMGDPKYKQYFVIRHAGPQHVSTERSQTDIWQGVVERVANASVLGDCIFLATGRLRDFKTEVECSLQEYGKDHKAYRLQPNHHYQMSLHIFDRANRPDSNQEIVIRSSSDLITVSQPFASVIGGPVEQTVLLFCKRSIENTLATLVMDVRDSDDSTQSNGTGRVDGARSAVICAKPRYLLHVSLDQTTLFRFMLYVFLGVLLTSTSVEFFRDEWIKTLLCWQPFTAPVLALIAKLTGAGFLAAAAYLGFRKLPSGSPGG